MGKNLVTGESLTKFERTMAAVEVITLGVGSAVGKTMKAAHVGAEAFKDVAKAIEAGEDLVRVADDAKNAIRAAENFGAKSVKEMQNVYVDLASSERRKHILFGEGVDGGGHLFPVNPLNLKNTAFPESWSEDKIMHEISDVVTDPKVEWFKGQKNIGTQIDPKDLINKVNDANRFTAIVEREGVHYEFFAS